MALSTTSFDTSSVLSSVISYAQDFSGYLMIDVDGNFKKTDEEAEQFDLSPRKVIEQREESESSRAPGKYKTALQKFRGYPKIFIISPRPDYLQRSEGRDDQVSVNQRVEVTNEQGKFKSSLHKALYRIRLQQYDIGKSEEMTGAKRRYKVLYDVSSPVLELIHQYPWR